MNRNILTLSIQIITTISLINSHANQFSNLKFNGTQKTLNKIIEIISSKQKGAYLRFGDGDINLALGSSELFQSANNSLQNEMREAFSLHSPTILKALPLHCKELGGYESGMFPGNHEAPYDWCLNILNKARPLWNGEINEVYSPIALHFSATEYPDSCIRFLNFLKNSNCCIFVGNENIPPHITELLFGRNCKFIPTPAQQSYNKIDHIEKECLEKIGNTSEYKIIITAMGCSGRVLQKRLWNKLDNVFLFDFGSLMDALCGWNTRAWIELTQFDATKFINNLTREVKILYTVALIDFDYESRRQEYINTLNILRDYGYPEPYIVEAIKPGPHTFLNKYSNNVIYSNVNNPSLGNKGVNEAKSIKEAFKKIKFNDNDMIVKITGRYYFTSDEFLKTIEDHPSIDAFVTTDSSGQVFTGCFALRFKFFRDLIDQLDYEKMEREMINIEQEVAWYLKRIINEQSAHVMYLNCINVVANGLGNGTKYALHYW